MPKGTNQKLKLYRLAPVSYTHLDPLFADYRPEQCQQDLTMLTEWKNLNTIQDTKKVASIEEFKNKKYRYQMTESVSYTHLDVYKRQGF